MEYNGATIERVQYTYHDGTVGPFVGYKVTLDGTTEIGFRTLGGCKWFIDHRTTVTSGPGKPLMAHELLPENK